MINSQTKPIDFRGKIGCDSEEKMVGFLSWLFRWIEIQKGNKKAPQLSTSARPEDKPVIQLDG